MVDDSGLLEVWEEIRSDDRIKKVEMIVFFILLV